MNDRPAALFSSTDEDDLAVRLQRELEEDVGAGWAVPEETASRVAGQGDDGFAQDSEGTGEGPRQAAADAERGEAERRAGPDAPFVAANSDSRRMRDFRSAVLDDVGAGAMEGIAPLVSGRTGELVGASFDELAKAIREGELRSLEDMAQELLRPMLQDWLDDNLPHLVERLVREEIERVARGGRR